MKYSYCRIFPKLQYAYLYIYLHVNVITVVQPSLWQPTRLSQTSSLSVKNQTKSKISNEHASQLSSSDDTKDSLKQQVITLPACAVNKPTDKEDDVVLTKRSQASVAEKQNKHEVPVSCIQTELTTKSSDVVHSDLHLSQLATQPNIPTSDLKEQFANKSEYFDNISVEETHYKHKTNLKYTPEPQNSSTMVSQSLRNNKVASTVTCESKEQMSSTGTLPSEVYKRRHTEMAEHKSDKTNVSAVSHPLQSSSRNEPPLHDEVSYEEADENVMFEELFGSSGEEEDHREDDDTIEGAVSDGSDIEMELGVAYHEMEQRKVEEEFKRITTHSSNVPHTSVSM